MSDNKINAYNASFNRADAAHNKPAHTDKKDRAEKQDPAGQEVSSDKQAGKAEQSKPFDEKQGMTAKNQLNASIIQASLDVSIASKNDSLTLLYKAAIQGINDALEPEMGPEAIQKAAANGEDHSPEATSTRIVGFVAALYELYRQQKVDGGEEKSEEEMATDFINIVGKGVDQGFKEARGILSGLGVLKGEIASNIDKTYDLVQKGLQLFIDSKKTKEQAVEDPSANPPAGNVDNKGKPDHAGDTGKPGHAGGPGSHRN